MRRPEMRERMRAKKKRQYKTEIHRLLGGEKAQTRYNFTILSPKIHNCIKRLRNIYGYVSVRNSCVLYYDEETDRRLDMRFCEDWYTQKYGLTFRPIEDLS